MVLAQPRPVRKQGGVDTGIIAGNKKADAANEKAAPASRSQSEAKKIKRRWK
jgi:hypothetical protein